MPVRPSRYCAESRRWSAGNRSTEAVVTGSRGLRMASPGPVEHGGGNWPARSGEGRSGEGRSGEGGCSPSRAKATVVAVKLLVEVTEISGPACRYMPPSHCRAMALPTRVRRRGRGHLALQLLDGSEGVVSLAGLADPDVERVRLHHRVAVAELRGWLGRRRDAGQVLDELRADLARVVGRATAEHQDPAELPGVRARPGSARRGARCGTCHPDGELRARSTARGCSWISLRMKCV